MIGTVLAHIVGSTPSSGTYRFYFQDNIGSTRRLRNDDAGSYAFYEYTPYGHVYDHSGSDVRYRFTGKEWDDTAELYYFPYRYYSPSIARWITRDPIPTGNLYAYVGGRPLSRTDRLGLTPIIVDPFPVPTPPREQPQKRIIDHLVTWYDYWWDPPKGSCRVTCMCDPLFPYCTCVKIDKRKVPSGVYSYIFVQWNIEDRCGWLIWNNMSCERWERILIVPPTYPMPSGWDPHRRVYA